MFERQFQRWFDPSVGGERRAAVSGATLVGFLVVLAALASGAGLAALVWGLAGFTALLIPCLHVYRAQRKAAQEARELWSLNGVTATDGVWPAPGGWALGPAAIKFLISEVRKRRYVTVVELGPGASSVFLGRACPGLEMYGLEHDEHFLEIVSDLIRSHDIQGYSLIHAPLEQKEDGTNWYSAAALDRVPQLIDVLIIDGPPNWRAAGNRRPAYAALKDRMRPGGLVVIDDTHRLDERQMALEWVNDPAAEMILDADDFIAVRIGDSGGGDHPQ